MRSTLALRVLRVAASVAALGVVLTPSVALADCMMPPPVEEAVKTAEFAFVGTVTETTNQDRWASVVVGSVWRGPDTPVNVVVQGGGGPAAGITSVDRTYKTGLKYLFLPYGNRENMFFDNICTNTVEWSDDLEQLEPADVRPPLGAIETGGPFFDVGAVIAPLGVALLVGGALLFVGLIARGRTA